MSHGLPVVCLDLGGPGVIVNDTCGRVVSVQGCTYDKVVEDLGKALVEIANNRQLYDDLSKGALTCASELSWKDLVEKVYVEIAEMIEKK